MDDAARISHGQRVDDPASVAAAAVMGAIQLVVAGAELLDVEAGRVKELELVSAAPAVE